MVDGAEYRRSKPTRVAKAGVAAALIEGDHLLCTAYVLAARTGSPAFIAAFARAVERTVAGERLQGKSTGTTLTMRQYRNIVALKSGELFGCALAAAALLCGDRDAWRHYALGRRVGTLYQMLDDVLDYFPAAQTGKPPLADARQKRWTWPLLYLNGVNLDNSPEELSGALFAPDTKGITPMQRCLDAWSAEADHVTEMLAAYIPHDSITPRIIEGWARNVAHAMASVTESNNTARTVHELRSRIPGESNRGHFFAHNSRSFSFAARLIQGELRESVTAVYTFCRVTDELADGGEGGTSNERLALLNEWERLAQRAYSGENTSIKLLDDAMGTAAQHRVPFQYVAELVEGMRMDMLGVQYQTMAELRVYSYRVAGVTGEWLARLSGVHAPAGLRHASALGHAFQLTNILRDVGEDLRRGRVYLPHEVLRKYGLEHADLRDMLSSGRPTEQYKRLIEHLMAVAEGDYNFALRGQTWLPTSFRRSVVAAAAIYRGIHDEIRRNGYNNLTVRAHTSAQRKVYLTTRALFGAGERSQGKSRAHATEAAR